jgi:hypothetical protein
LEELLMSDWGDRSLSELATSSQNDRYDVLSVLGAPVGDGAANAQAQAQAQAPARAAADAPIRQAAEEQYTVGPDGLLYRPNGTVHRPDGMYHAGGLVPDGKGGGVIIPPGPPAGQDQPGPYQGQPGPYNNQIFGGAWTPTAPRGNEQTIGSPGYYNQQRQGALDTHRAEVIRRSLYSQFNSDSYWPEGAAGGLLGATVFPWAMDKVFAGEKGGWLGEQWRKHYSPIEMEVDGQQKVRTNEEGTAAKAQAKATEAEAALKTGTAKLNALVADATKEYADIEQRDPQLSDSERLRYQDRITYLKAAAEHPELLKLKEIEQRTQNGAETPVELKLLSPAEGKLLLDRYYNQKDLVKSQSTLEDAQARMGDLDAAITKIRSGANTRVSLIAGYTDGNGRVLGKNYMNSLNTETMPWYEKITSTWQGDSVKMTTQAGTSIDAVSTLARRGGVGALAATVGLGIDYIGDKLLFGKDHYPDNASVFQSMDAPLMAAAAIIPKNPVFKVGGMLAAYAGTNALDKLVGASNEAAYSEFFKPNWVEALGMGVGWMTPFRSPMAHAAAVGIGWGIGKLANIPSMYGADILGIHPTDIEARQWDGVSTSLNDFGKSPSVDGFKNLVDTGTTLGMSNEGALGARIATFDQDHASDQTPRRFEALAALDMSLGNMWLQRGSKLNEADPDSHNDKGRILSQWQYDLGGDAAVFYTGARGNLALAANYLNQSGANPSDVARVQAEQDMVQDKLNQIYGAHNINGIYNELLTDLRSRVGTTVSQFSIDQLMVFENEVKRRADGPTNNDPAYRGKLYRDLSMLDFAIAQFKAEGGDGVGARTFYQQGTKYLAGSNQFAQNNADAQQLQLISEGIGQTIEPAIDQQYSNGFNNPHGVQRPQ